MKTLTATEIIESESRFASGLYTKQPIIFVRGQGASLWDIDGVEYLDCICQYTLLLSLLGVGWAG